MKISICISCGSKKSNYGSECPACHFKPESQSDLAKSLLLSEDAVFNDLDLPKKRDELTKISLLIAGDKPYPVDQAQLDELQKRVDEVRVFAQRVTWPRLILLYGLPVVFVWLAIGYLLYMLPR